MSFTAKCLVSGAMKYTAGDNKHIPAPTPANTKNFLLSIQNDLSAANNDNADRVSVGLEGPNVVKAPAPRTNKLRYWW